MTNEQILMVETQKLAQAGILKYTGRTFKALNIAGEEVEIKEVEPIHTLKIWNILGYRVRKGQHAKAKFPIWFWKNKKKVGEEEDSNAHEGGDCYMRTASWFTFDQVEKIEEKNNEGNAKAN